ncbi:MAG: glycoside hydrolase family 43 protein [Bacteroidota bacterium]
MIDTDGNRVNAHGGGVLLHEGTYYWYGEVKKGNTSRVPGSSWENYRVPAGGVSCYSSKDLINWNYEGLVLRPETTDMLHDLHSSKVIERPKVIYNTATGKFVMWMHIDLQDYSFARSGVAISDSPAGPFVYLRSVQPNGNQARDMTLFVAEDGNAYHFYTSEENATIHVCRLTDDYLSHTKDTKRLLPGQFREAPAVFQHGKNFYLISSGCTGWTPNKTTYAMADTIMGDWLQFGSPCAGPNADLTFNSQGSYIFPFNGEDFQYVFMADRWNMTDLENSGYLWLPLKITATGVPVISWKQDWNPNPSTL